MNDPQTKIIYNYNDDFIYTGPSTLYEASSLTGIFLFPAKSTEIVPPDYNRETEFPYFSELDNCWIIKERPTQENTPKPYLDKNVYKAVWNYNRWDIAVKLPHDFPTKPKYNTYTQYLDLEEGEWIIKDIIRTPENTPKPAYNSNFYTIKWDTDKWILEEIINWVTVKDKRYNLLQCSDWTGLNDVSLPNKQQWVEYRQALRDIPQNFTNPGDVVWPEKP